MPPWRELASRVTPLVGSLLRVWHESARQLAQVDRGRPRDGEQNAGVAEIARQQQQNAGHEADGDGDEPGEPVKRHSAILAETTTARRPGTTTSSAATG